MFPNPGSNYVQNNCYISHILKNKLPLFAPCVVNFPLQWGLAIMFPPIFSRHFGFRHYHDKEIQTAEVRDDRHL